jgi:hypothetical protein
MAIEINEDLMVRRVPQIGQQYRSKNFSIEILDKKASKECKPDVSVATIVSSSIDKYKVGDLIEIEEVAFYSDYYEFVK